MPVPFPPVEPPASRVRFPDPRRTNGRGLVAEGPDFSPGTLLQAYRSGIFPWPEDSAFVPWVCPDQRAIFPLERPTKWSRSLQRTLRKKPYRVSIDSAFREVIQACADARQERTWIVPEMIEAYTGLHELGWCHSVEVWDRLELVGGIYGVAVGGTFAGESMFHSRTDASKIAFASLVEHLRRAQFLLFDVQVLTPHLASLGCTEISRAEFLARHEASVGSGPRAMGSFATSR